MVIKAIVDEDFNNYKKPSMFICAPRCTMKCGEGICQNSPWLKMPDIEIDNFDIIDRYESNSLTKAIVIGGLESLDLWDDLCKFIIDFRTDYHPGRDDDIVIYTGYNKDEITDKINILWHFGNIIIKYGRYVPGQKPHYDKVLGVDLASDNQYAERID